MILTVLNTLTYKPTIFHHIFSLKVWESAYTWVRLKDASSSAVAKRPHDASCLSVVSFNSTKHQVESFIVSYVGYRFITACS